VQLVVGTSRTNALRIKTRLVEPHQLTTAKTLSIYSIAENFESKEKEWE
jgi:hypothetical protein